MWGVHAQGMVHDWERWKGFGSETCAATTRL